jgi:hypothetical protein
MSNGFELPEQDPDSFPLDPDPAPDSDVDWPTVPSFEIPEALPDDVEADLPGGDDTRND